MRTNEPICDKNDETAKQWLTMVASFDLPEHPRSRVEEIASKHLGERSCKVTDRFEGGFNYGFRVQTDDGCGDYVLRFPIPGWSMNPVAKWKSEVATLQFLQQETRIPIPKLVASGIAEGEFKELGPYILIDFVEGIALDRVLQQEGGRLKDAIKPEVMKIFYKRIAVWYVELFQHSFPKIGSLSAERDSEEGPWTFDIDSAPITSKLNEMERCGGVKYKGSPSPFTTTADYYQELLTESAASLAMNDRASNSKEEFNADYKTLHILKHRADHFAPLQAANVWTDNDGAPERFVLFCDDMRFSNMMVDKQYEIQAFFDWEFSYAAPAGFLCDPPSWLAGSLEPQLWTPEEAAAYDARVRDFIEGIEEAERDATRNRYGHELSRRMRASWENGSFWYNFMMRSGFQACFVMDLCKDREPFCSVPPPDTAEMEARAEQKMKDRPKDDVEGQEDKEG